MSTHLRSQGSAIVKGVNAFEPVIKRLHTDYQNGAITDWPTVVLATTLQATAISLFKLLPNPEDSTDLLDRRSIATLVRNIVDTHDVLDMVTVHSNADELDLNRNILGLYISSRFERVQTLVDRDAREQFWSHTKSWYWARIKASPIYTRAMAKLESGEQLFHRSRKDRAQAACGDQTEFVLGILADLSTYVHSVSPVQFMSELREICANTTAHQDAVAVWLRLASFFMARSFAIVLRVAGYTPDRDLTEFLKHHESAFQ